MPNRKVQSIPVPVSEKRKSRVALASRKKKSANSTSFKPGNQYRFPEGTSGNVGGKPKEHRLLSKSLRAMLSDPAPLAVAEAFGLGRNASWSQCIAARLVRQAVSGDLDAARLIGILSEGANPRTRLYFDDDEPVDRNAPLPPPLFQVVFVESDGEGRPRSDAADLAKPTIPAAD